MKKIVFSLIALCIAFSASAQFKLTKDGFVNASDPAKSYIVLDASGLTQGDILDVVVSYLEDNYNFGCCRIDNVGNDIIVFSMACNAQNQHTLAAYRPGGDYLSPRSERMGKMNSHVYNSLEQKAFVQNFSVTFRIKDEKLRVDTPKLYGFVIPIRNKFYHGSLYNPDRNRNRNLFKANGTPEKNREGAIKGLESYFNSMVNGIFAPEKDTDW